MLLLRLFEVQVMGPFGGSGGGRDPDTVRTSRGEHGRYPPPPYTSPLGGPIEHRERRDSYWTWLILGLVSPFLLAGLLYPLAWWAVWTVVLPVARLV